MWEVHPACDTPDPAAVLWHYMPYAAYLELLRTRSLHFTRLDQLRDPWEGHVEGDYGWDRIGGGDSETPPPTPAHKRQFAVSCWCRRVTESMSFWERYGSSFGVAIRTSAGALCEGLRDAGHLVRLSNVKYDAGVRQRDSVPGNVLEIARRKLPAYSDENEVRALLWGLDSREGLIQPHRPRSGIWPVEGVAVEVNLSSLVQEVVVGPPWTTWFHAQVQELSAAMGIPAARVARSKLMDRPS